MGVGSSLDPATWVRDDVLPPWMVLMNPRSPSYRLPPQRSPEGATCDTVDVVVVAAEVAELVSGQPVLKSEKQSSVRADATQ